MSGDSQSRMRLKSELSQKDLEQENSSYAITNIEKELEELHKKYKLGEQGELDATKKKKKKSTSSENAVDASTNIAEMSTSMVQTFRGKMSAIETLSKLQEQARTYLKKIEAEKKRTKEIDGEMEKLTEETEKQRKALGGVRLAQQENAKKQKQIKMLEDKLEKARVKYNEALSSNKHLREKIDNLRRERVVFDGVYTRLEKELAEKKEEMQKIVEVSNAAYDARERANQEMEALRNQAEQEQKAFEAEWNELGKLIEHDAKMKEYMKQREKALKSGVDMEDEEKLRKKILKSNPNIAKDKAAQQASLRKVQEFEEAFAKIQAATGISDIDELVATFIEAEDQNFSLFNYVNELNSEVEKLEEQIADLRKEIEKHRGQAQNTDNQKRKVLQELEDKLAKTEARTEQYETRVRKATETITVLKDGIQDVFDKIGCSQNGVMEILGTTGVTEGNMMQYLGIIEQRTNEILQIYAAIQMQQQGVPLQESLLNILGQGPTVSAGSVKLQVNAPNMNEDSDSMSDSDEDDHPLSRKELLAKVKSKVERSEAAAPDESLESTSRKETATKK
uniref:ODAD1 central coiled coil region domain-containing protein n=1 Tax=Hanusia phi TaxID=3032 RepID=A0A7S0EMC5_9CRYP|mmetsp:Transcript_26395/g.60004  ORF Transcript_26395/g.60004 Transcript_26395/m.60004 type:complete len:565 (+) Transcript_26395:142-1836(+)